MYSRETELRHLQSTDVYKLGQILDPNNSWKKLMQLIPKDVPVGAECKAIGAAGTGDNGYKYNNDHIRLVENESIRQVRLATEILFDEWGTSGKRRPNVGLLLDLLVRAELFRAADLVALNFLNEPPPKRPTTGPAAKIDISSPFDSELFNDIENMLDNGSPPGTEMLNASSTSLADNKDFYTKYDHKEKLLNEFVPPIAPPRASRLSRLQHEATTVEALTENDVSDEVQTSSEHSQEIPKLSQLLQPSGGSSSTEINGGLDNSYRQVDANYSATTIMTTSDANPNTETTNLSDIPILSALGNTDGEESQVILPMISALNLNTSTDYDDKHRLTVNSEPSCQSRTSCRTSESSNLDEDDEDIGLPEGLAEDDDEDISVPNRSLLDQRSSNNDSSLTNVTGTSGDNSFELSMNDGSFDASNDNIPHLSILQQ